MTDSKTTDWATDKAIESVNYSSVCLLSPDEFNTVIGNISQALLSAYERGRKEGIEEAAKVATAYRTEHTQMSVDALDLGRELDLATSTKAATVSASIVEAIRQLLEVKG